MNFKFSICALALLLTAGNAHAVGALVDIAIYDRVENRVLPVYFYEGRYYVAGKPGNEYQLTIRNQQAGEIMTVVSVDGVNAVSGETANWGQTGYVFAPNTSFSIKGWRKSMQRVARFYFTELDNSYAARTGRPDNVGVIGVAVFRKKADVAIGLARDRLSKQEVNRGDGPAAEAQGAAADSSARNEAYAYGRVQPAAPAPQIVEKSLGTGHGAIENSQVTYTGFERASATPDEIISIYYDSYHNLAARGVIRNQGIARPTPFPGQFVPDPQ